MAGPLRLSLCNELFERLPFPLACERIRDLGYTGIEIAPYTLGPDAVALSAEHRRDLSRTMEHAGLEFVGLHWLLAAPTGLHVTTPDRQVRERSWNQIRHLIDLCADLASPAMAEKGVLVFGSPKQRSTVDGMSPAEAVAVFTESLAEIAPLAEARGVKILIEALPANQSDVINTLAEAVAIVNQIGSPAIQTMFDTHNTIDEKEEHASLIRKYRDFIRHVHVNELDGREPGMGSYDFESILEVLAETSYQGWISLEVFDFSRDAEMVAQRARLHLESAVSKTL